MDLPVLVFAGSSWLLICREVAGATGLVIPGFVGGIMTLVALIRAAGAHQSARSTHAPE